MLKNIIPLCLLALSVLSAPVQAADPLKDALKVQILPGWRAADGTHTEKTTDAMRAILGE